MPNYQQTASFQAPTDYNVEAAEIARRKAYAQALQQQGMTPTDEPQTGMFHHVTSPMSGLGSLAQVLSGKYQENKAVEDEKKLAQKSNTERQQTFDRISALISGSPDLATDPAKVQLASLNTGTIADSVPDLQVAAPQKTTPEQRNLLIAQLLSRSGLQDQRQLGEKLLIDSLMKKPTAPIKVGQNDTLVDPSTFKPVFTPTPQPKFHVVGGNLVQEPAAGQTQAPAPAFTAPKDKWSEPYQLGGQTVQRNDETGQIRQAVTLPHQTNVNVNTERSYFGNVAEGLAKQDVAAIDAARSAPQRIESARSVKQFLDKNPITGSFAEQRLSFEKALSTAGLIDGERVKNTESLASNLAAQTLDAIKTSGLGSGQGFTDKDRQFLERAKSGNIEINSGTLRQLADLNEKAARVSLQRGNELIRKLKGNKQMGAVGVGLDEIPEPSGGGSDFKILNVRPR